MPTILDRITSLWQRRATPPTVTAPPAAAPTAQATFSAAAFTTQRDRRSKIADCRQMVEDDPRPKQILATLARDATKGGFTLQLTGPRAAAAQVIADALFARIKLNTRLDDWARLTFRDGDTFLELGVAANGEIVEITRKPSLEMYRWSDDFDRFFDPAAAFYWTDQPTAANTPPPGATLFPEWQIVHARWDRDEGSRYGTPLLASARRAYKRMTQGELDIAIRRKTRAGLRYLHILEGASPAEIEAYRAMNAPALGDNFAAVSDFFSNKAGGIQLLQGDANLSQIDDVLHHVDTFGVASLVPLELIGYGRNLNRDVLEQKKEQYDEAVGSVRGWLVAEFILPILERQWLMLGIWPDALEVDVQWKAKKEATPLELKDMAAFATAVKAASILTDPTLLRILATRLPDFDVDAEIAALEGEAAEREAADRLEMQRMAVNAQAAAQDGGDGDDDADQEAQP
jgi:hypothetical protein